MIKTLLWDIDNTLLDFQAAEKAAMQVCFQQIGLGECTDQMITRYSEINRSYWLRLEQGKISKPQVLVGRFQTFFEQEGLPVHKAEAFNDLYQVELGETCVFMDRSYELIKCLRDKGYHQYAVTNGTVVAQNKKLKKSGLGSLLDGAFISDLIGYEKPSKGFFDAVFQELSSSDLSEFLLIGDSLTSDIKGAVDAGILCCWYNPRHLVSCDGTHPDFEISDLWDICKILKQGNI